MLCAVAANAADYETFVVDNIKYAITGEDIVIVWRGTDELAGEVSIPATVTNSETGTTYTVTAIDKEAFYRNSNITSVTIAEGIKKIGDNAFTYTGIKSIVIPSNDTSISDNAFDSCMDLDTIIVLNKDLTISTSQINDKVVVLYPYTVTLPEGTTVRSGNVVRQVGNKVYVLPNEDGVASLLISAPETGYTYTADESVCTIYMKILCYVSGDVTIERVVDKKDLKYELDYLSEYQSDALSGTGYFTAIAEYISSIVSAQEAVYNDADATPTEVSNAVSKLVTLNNKLTIYKQAAKVFYNALPKVENLERYTSLTKKLSDLKNDVTTIVTGDNLTSDKFDELLMATAITEDNAKSDILNVYSATYNNATTLYTSLTEDFAGMEYYAEIIEALGKAIDEAIDVPSNRNYMDEKIEYYIDAEIALYNAYVAANNAIEAMSTVTPVCKVIVSNSNESDVWYDLNGRRYQGKPATRGLYIHNNQKVLVK